MKLLGLRIGLNGLVLLGIGLIINCSIAAQNGNWNVSLNQSTTGSIAQIEFSDDDKYLVTGSSRGYIQLIEVRTQRVIYDIEAHNGGVTDLLFAKGGELLISSSSTGVVKFWSVSTGRQIREIKCYKNGVKGLRVGPKDSSLLFAIPDRNIDKISYWNINTGERIGTLPSINFDGTLFFTHEPKRVITDTDRGLKYFDLSGLNSDSLLFFPPENHHTVYSISPDKTTLAIIDRYSPMPAWRTFDRDPFIVDEDSLRDGYIVKEKIKTRWELDQYRGINYSKKSIRASRPIQVAQKPKDDQDLVIVNRHFPVQVIDLKRMTIKKTDIKKIYNATFSPDNKKILSTDEDGKAKLWALETSQIEKEYLHHGGYTGDRIGAQISTLAIFSHDSKYLFLSSKDGGAEIWNTKTHEKIVDVRKSIIDYLDKIDYFGSFEFAEHASFSNDGNLLAVSRYDELFIFNLTATDIETRPAEVINLTSSVFSPSGDWLMTSTERINGYLWNLHDLSYQQIPVLSSQTQNFQTIAPSPNGDVLAIVPGIDPPFVLNLDNSERVELPGHKGSVVYMSFAETGNRIITASFDGTARVWNSKTGKLISELNRHSGKLYYGELSFNGRMALTIGTDGITKIWDVDDGRTLYSFKSLKYHAVAKFSIDGKKVLCLNKDGISLSLYSTQDGALLRTFSGQKDLIATAVFHPDGKTLFSYSKTGNVTRWSLETGERTGRIDADDDTPASASLETFRLSPSANYFATITFDDKVKVWNSKDLRLVSTLTDPEAEIVDVNFAPDEKSLVTISSIGQATIWDWKKQQQLASLTNLKFETDDGLEPENPEFLWLDKKDQYYYASKSATKEIYFQKENKTLNFDQLDVRYNRPDKVLQAINSADSYLIEAYKKAYEKRIDKLEIDTTKFDNEFIVPQAEIINSDKLNYNQNTGFIELDLKFTSQNSYLNKVNILVNGVPVYGARGISLQDRKINRLDTTIRIELSKGKNQIEALALNENGIKNYRNALVVQNQPQKITKPKVYFVGLGVDQYKNPENNLKFSVKDIRDLARAMKAKYGASCIIDTLLNQSVNVQNLRRIKEKLLNTSVDDKVIVAYAGHGLLSDEMDYYLGTYHTNFDSPDKGGLPYQELENILDSIPSRQKLLLVDACHSGEIDPEEKQKLDQTISENKGLVSGTARGVTDPNESSLGMNSTFQLMQQIFVNLSNDIGATVISAASGDQLAKEENGNGVFTNAILSYMENKDTFTIGQLKSYVSTKVKVESKGQQQPTSRLENLVNDWVLWQ